MTQTTQISRLVANKKREARSILTHKVVTIGQLAEMLFSDIRLTQYLREVLNTTAVTISSARHGKRVLSYNTLRRSVQPFQDLRDRINNLAKVYQRRDMKAEYELITAASQYVTDYLNLMQSLRQVQVSMDDPQQILEFLNTLPQPKDYDPYEESHELDLDD